MNRSTLPLPHFGLCFRASKKCFRHADAAKVAQLLRRRHDTNHHPYHCEACGWWHVGSSERLRPSDRKPASRRISYRSVNRGVAA